MREPRGQELIKRYKENYHIPVSAEITEEMILMHWELEKLLTTVLLESTPENRWEVFESTYGRLYSELNWLNDLVGADGLTPPSILYRDWVYLIGAPPMTIYEIGSGKGVMIRYLAGLGFTCRASEITHERGQKWADQHPNLSWGITDGVNLGKFESHESYDVVISNQVIEHLHPDAILEHLRGVCFILREGGKYIFSTPHNYFGPSDVSRVFKCDKPHGMHLKEYTYQALKEALAKSGFKQIYAAFRIPNIRFTRPLGSMIKTRPSRIYLYHLLLIEKLIALLPDHKFRQAAARLSQMALFFPSIFLVAEKD